MKKEIEYTQIEIPESFLIYETEKIICIKYKAWGGRLIHLSKSKLNFRRKNQLVKISLESCIYNQSKYELSKFKVDKTI
jgi:hypothetical protein